MLSPDQWKSLDPRTDLYSAHRRHNQSWAVAAGPVLGPLRVTTPPPSAPRTSQSKGLTTRSYPKGGATPAALDLDLTSYAMKSGFVIVFDANMGGNSAALYIDDIQVVD